MRLLDGLARNDRWLADAATAVAARNDLSFLKALSAHQPRKRVGAEVLAIAGRVAEHWARGGPGDTGRQSSGGTLRRRAFGE